MIAPYYGLGLRGGRQSPLESPRLTLANASVGCAITVNGSSVSRSRVSPPTAKSSQICIR
jgi:hypothetical protein